MSRDFFIFHNRSPRFFLILHTGLINIEKGMTKTRNNHLDVDEILERSLTAAAKFRQMNQEQTDRIVRAVYEAGFNQRIRLAKLACE